MKIKTGIKAGQSSGNVRQSNDSDISQRIN